MTEYARFLSKCPRFLAIMFLFGIGMLFIHQDSFQPVYKMKLNMTECDQVCVSKVG